MNIVFFGSTSFSAHILDAILQNKTFSVVSVITTYDTISGRGLKSHFSDVKKYGISKGLNIQQPENLKDKNFINDLKAFNADVFVVVAFRLLPEIIWQMAPTFNLHASLLPQYRGAAPIERALMNGDTETGVTTFFLQKKIDTGDILLQKKVLIDVNDNSYSLRQKLSTEGSKIVIETLKAIKYKTLMPISQNEIIKNNKDYFSKLVYAHKLEKKDFIINWEQSAIKIYNQIRALSELGAYTILNKVLKVKIFSSSYKIEKHNYRPGEIIICSKNRLCIASIDGFIEPIQVQPEGKKIMQIQAFINGYKNKIIVNDAH